MNATRQMSLEQMHASRAEQRRQRLIEAELEQAAEEAEALHMTEEQRQLLMQPFAAVKAEFADLDGLRWTQTALRKLQPPQRRATTHLGTPSPPNVNHDNSNAKFVVLTNADLASFSTEDTIRVSSSSSSSHSRPRLPSSLSYPHSVAKSALLTPDLPYRHRDGTRSRSPIKGLFPPPSRPGDHDDDDDDSERRFLAGGVKHMPPSGLRFSVSGADEDEVAETDDDHDDEGVDTSIGLTPASSPRRMRTPAPPGLTPAPTYSPQSQSSIGLPAQDSELHPFLDHNPQQQQAPPRPTRALKRRKTSDLVPHPHRDAPSPPMSSSPPASIPTSASPPTSTVDLSMSPFELEPDSSNSLSLSLLRPPSPPSLLASRSESSVYTIVPSSSGFTSTTPNANGTGNGMSMSTVTPRSARARLHSLLHDERRSSSSHSGSVSGSVSAPSVAFSSSAESESASETMEFTSTSTSTSTHVYSRTQSTYSSTSTSASTSDFDSESRTRLRPTIDVSSLLSTSSSPFSAHSTSLPHASSAPSHSSSSQSNSKSQSQSQSLHLSILDSFPIYSTPQSQSQSQSQSRPRANSRSGTLTHARSYHQLRFSASLPAPPPAPSQVHSYTHVTAISNDTLHSYDDDDTPTPSPIDFDEDEDGDTDMTISAAMGFGWGGAMTVGMERERERVEMSRSRPSLAHSRSQIFVRARGFE